VRRALVAVTVLVAGLLAACSSEDGTATEIHGSQVDPPFTVDRLALEDTEGEPFSLVDDTDARLTLVFFGYTRCPQLCGLVMSNLASAMLQLDEADREQVDVVFVTTDPERDTPELLRDYVQAYDPSFIGVTGPLEDIEAVATSMAVGMGEELPSGGYEVDAHTTNVTGVDVAGEAPIYWRQTTSPAQYVHDIHALLEEPE
jgi:protein SCO1/2